MSTSLDLDDLLALNDEIAGLVRAGLPLDVGLRAWSRDLRGPLARQTAALGKAVAGGQNLAAALGEPKLGIPPLYRSVVAAGLRCGRLPAALEALADAARHLKQLRTTAISAVLYPLVLVLVGYWLLLSLVTIALPAIASMYEGDPPAILAAIVAFSRWLQTGIPIPGTNRVFPLLVLPPIVLVAAFVWWLVRTRRATLLRPAPAWLSWLPGTRTVMNQARRAAVAEIFGLLVEHSVPVDEAWQLAAACIDDPAAEREAQRLGEDLRAGRHPTADKLAQAGLPRPLATLVAGGASQATLVAMARHTATYERRVATRRAQWFADWLPIWLILIVGSAVALIFCLTFFVPYTQLIEALSFSRGQSLRIHP